MENKCRQYNHIAEQQAGAWVRGEYNVAQEMLKRLNGHERDCRECSARTRGIGFIDGLLPGAVLGEDVEVRA